MSTYTEQKVRELAVAVPGATRVFEELGIDYCCGGGKSLREACQKAGISIESVTEALERGKTRYTQNTATDWQSRSLTDLAAYIVEKHHGYTRNEVSRLEQLAAKVASVHGKNHPELLKIRDRVQYLGSDLMDHMMKEEQVLFPRIALLEEATGKPESLPDGFVRMPASVMMQEHDAAGQLLRELRATSSNYAVPADACISYRTLYQALQELERDLHEHIHLENNILFPKAARLEDNSRS